jgi:ankyrin repeat protein
MARRQLGRQEGRWRFELREKKALGARGAWSFLSIFCRPAAHSMSKTVEKFKKDTAKQQLADLLEAAVEGDEKRLVAALDSGVKVDGTDQSGLTALMHAVSMGKENCAEILVQRGASVFRFDKDGWTALHYVAVRGHAALLAKMLAAIDPKRARQAASAQNNEGHTPLMIAAREDHPDSVKALLPWSDAKQKGGDDWTALHHAARGASEKCVGLIAPLSDLGAKNKGGMTAEDLCGVWGFDLCKARIAQARAIQEREALLGAAQSAGEPKKASRGPLAL